VNASPDPALPRLFLTNENRCNTRCLRVARKWARSVPHTYRGSNPGEPDASCLSG
jgi:hypothetical protein